VALGGTHFDGRRFIPNAIEAGAAAVAFEGEGEFDGAANLRVESAADFLALAAHRFYGDPSANMTVLGITGTNGKTTTTYLLESIFTAAGKNVGVIGTVNYRFGGKTLDAPNTTPMASDLAALMAQMRDAGVDTVVMEVSSHALDQRRVLGVNFDVACLSNLTRDHLDYHENFEEYFAAKASFFSDYLPRTSKARPVACVNLDDPRGVDFLAACSTETLTYGSFDGSDVRLGDLRIDGKGLRGRLIHPHGSTPIVSGLLGDFSASNVMAAVTMALGMGVSLEKIRVGIENTKFVPGRLEPVASDEFLVLVDYAHTPNALENVISSMTKLAKGRLITVFGCGGDRDPGKRPMMGSAVASICQVSVVTSDNPRTESPHQIIEQILEGVEPFDLDRVEPDELASYERGRGLIVEPDRRKAIELAVMGARPGDVVLIAGKGHEDYQIIGTVKHDFDDRVEAAKALAMRKEKQFG
jgi:UDP-N-acetylmuramoyl-L-alanyl-D-glutamate--2,6-diaminopimelate ligase